MLAGRTGTDDVVIRGARVLDPVEGIDATLDVRIDGGVIAQIGRAARHERASGRRRRRADARARRSSTRTCTCARRAARTRRRSRAAPRPPRQAATARSSRSRTPIRSSTTPTCSAGCGHAPRRRRTSRSASWPRSRRARTGRSSPSWARSPTPARPPSPTTAARLPRRASCGGRSSTTPITGRMIAVHCEEPTLTRGGHAHAGAVAAELGLGGWPSLGESLMVARDLDLAGDTGQPVHLMHLSARESVEHLRRAHETGIRASGEATPHHLCLTDEAVRTLDPNVKMNPPLRSEDDRSALLEAVRDGTIAAIATDHAPHCARGEGRPVRGGAVRRHRSRDGVRGALHLPRRARCASARDGARADVGRACGDLRSRPAADRDRRAGEPDAGRPRTPRGASRRPTFRSRSINSWLLGQRLRGRVTLTIAAGRVVFEG